VALEREPSGAERLAHVWEANPFRSDAALSNSAYAAYDGESLVRMLEAARPSFAEIVAHASFRRFVEDPDFSCLGAKAAINRGTYRFGFYRQLGDLAVTEGLARDLFAFAVERLAFPQTFTTYVASFGTPIESEEEFEDALWRQLQRLNELDRQWFDWDPSVSSDPHDPNFSFSFAEQAFFVVGLHPKSSRRARRFAWPTLVFNAHEQFTALRAAGLFDNLQEKIRSRELRLQGSLNANLANYGEASEARQYSGRKVEARWKCPFRPKS
jgi:FPC/CPF motif-containing protein YcgG